MPLPLEPGPPADAPARGLELYRTGRKAEALELFARLALESPGDAQAHYLHGLTLFKLGRHPDALAPLRRATDLEGVPDAWIKLAMAQGQTGDMAACLTTLQEACRRFPDSPEAWAYLGTTLRSLDRLPEALEAYGHALERNPDHVPALWGLGLALGIEGRPVEGMTVLRRAIALDPAFPPPHFHLGVLALAAGDPGEARRQELLLRDLAPSYAGNLASLLQERNLDAPT